jgi:hypothetical protein
MIHLHLILDVSCDKRKACLESNVKTVCCASVLSRESSVLQEAEQSLKLQSWGSLMVQM